MYVVHEICVGKKPRKTKSNVYLLKVADIKTCAFI